MPDKDSRNYIYGIHTSNAQLKLNPTDIKKIFIKKNSQNKQLKKIILISNQHDIPLEENRFDVVFCNHVMEHVKDPIQCMSELCAEAWSEGRTEQIY